ncbi:MAG TPA: hypothetical protein VK864_17310 [Longimicrobiales bacterium]|nr:hypothetical protein [Longimicrobiales bacterium]
MTANHYVAVPLLSRTDGSIQSLNVLHRAAHGLLEWSGAREPAAGEPLLRPRLLINGAPAVLPDLTWERLERWIPRWRCTSQLNITGTVCAPTGYDAARRGLIYVFDVENPSTAVVDLDIALAGRWQWAFQTVCARRPLPARMTLARSATRDGFALEVAGAVNGALGISVYGSDVYYETAGDRIEAGDFRTAENGTPLEFAVGRRVRVGPGRRATIGFFLGFAAEREGALATAAALRRLGIDRALKETRLELARMTRKAGDPAVGAILNRHLLFCYFFGLGRALDDERLYPTTSRSPLHPRCATFNERDALLWSFPAILLADPQLAREMLMRCFEQYSHRPGEALRYLDGGVLEPGFSLSQWSAYLIALERYVTIAGDPTILDEPLVHEVLRELDASTYSRLHPEIFLASTELLPSGDLADQPYVSYDNALLHAFFRALERTAPPESADHKRFGAAADEVASALWRKCTADVNGLPVLAWSTDLLEAASVYDDPAGSLQLLPHYGFCEPTEPLWRNTMEFLRSSAYPLWLGDHAFPGLAARSQPKAASTAALCADLVSARAPDALAVLRRLSLVGDLAAATYDPDLGSPVGDFHDAALAGFLAWSLVEATKA